MSKNSSLARFRKYSPVFKFVLVFGGIYLVLSLLYAYFLDQDYNDLNYPDPVTATVTYHTHLLTESLGYEVRTMLAKPHPAIAMFVDGELLFSVIEGCNAVSVMILFVAFVLAFAKSAKRTAIFTAIGILMIYIVNLLRLVGLAMIYKHYPEYSDFSHEILFPGVIYGMVVLLWIYWIKPSKA